MYWNVATKAHTEAFIGLIAPIGIDIDSVQDAIQSALRTVNFKLNPIKLSDIISETQAGNNLSFLGEHDRYSKLIEAGNTIRANTNRDDFFAQAGIARLKEQFPERPHVISDRTVHFFRQIKRPEEISLFKEVYGTSIIFVACQSPRDIRINNLVNRFLKTDRSSSRTKLESNALDIIAKDENQQGVEGGQRVLDCFPHADFFLDCSDNSALFSSADRLVRAFFGDPFITPTVDEYGAFIARSASLRSSDLSRQVGAAIFGEKCEIISMGCNEVPKSGGGTYWTDDKHDARDFRLGHDPNARVKEDLIRDISIRLQRSGWLKQGQEKTAAEKILAAAFNSDSESSIFGESMISDLLEFGRVIHAEMNAITDAARFRRSTQDSTLYCTTMPCHMCARLIISSGIRRVVYIEPYYKSLVKELYSDSICFDEYSENRVLFAPFYGVGPNSFAVVFKKGRRKDERGRAIRWDRSKAMPIFTKSAPYYVHLETKIVFEDFVTAMESVRIRSTASPSSDKRAKNGAVSDTKRRRARNTTGRKPRS